MSAPEDETPDEFDWIERLRAQTSAPEAVGLLDDAAVIPSRPGYDLVISKDMVVEGVHFLPDILPTRLAWKALGTAVSDLAAKGAQPYGYFLGVAWPADTPVEFQSGFAQGLAKFEAALGIRLFGGDTVSSDRLMVSVTALGWVTEGGMVRRDQAQADTHIWVSGVIGDGFLGLLAAKGEIPGLSDEDKVLLTEFYYSPSPRTDLDLSLLDACIDVSDGLIADAGHLARASGVRLHIDLDAVPLSALAASWVDGQPDRCAALTALVTHGDDYQLLATGSSAPIGFQRIGVVTAGEGVSVVYRGQTLDLQRTGWRHGKDG